MLSPVLGIDDFGFLTHYRDRYNTIKTLLVTTPTKAKDGKTGFRDLDGNVVIKAIYESAERFSEGYSAVQVNGKWGLIDESGKYTMNRNLNM